MTGAMCSYTILVSLLLTRPAVLGEDDSLLVFDKNYIYQFPVDSMTNRTKYLHDSRSNAGFVDFLAVRRFSNSFFAVFGGCESSTVGLLIQNESTYAYQLPLNNSVRVCYAVPAFLEASFYALLKSQEIVLLDSKDDSTRVVLQLPEGTKCSRSNLQIDYEKHLLFYLDCSQNVTQFLRILNIASNVEIGKSLSRKIEKFEIDFDSSEIFAFSANALLKGKLNESKKINLELFHNESHAIDDLAVSPTSVYIKLTGGGDVRVIRRVDSISVPLNYSFDEARAIAYLEALRVKAKSGNDVIVECDDVSIQETIRRCFEDFEEQVEAFKKHEGEILFGGVDVEVVRSLCSHLAAATGCFQNSMKENCSKKSTWRMLDEFKRNFVALCSRKHLFEDYAMVQHCFWEARRTSLNCYQSFVQQSGHATTIKPSDIHPHHYHHQQQLHHHRHQHQSSHHHHHHRNRDTKDEYNVHVVLSGDEDDDDDYNRFQDREKCRLLKRLKSCVHYSLRFCGQRSLELSDDLVIVSVPFSQISLCPVQSSQWQGVFPDGKDHVERNDSMPFDNKESKEKQADGRKVGYLLDDDAGHPVEQQQQHGRSPEMSSGVLSRDYSFCKISITFVNIIVVVVVFNSVTFGFQQIVF